MRTIAAVFLVVSSFSAASVSTGQTAFAPDPDQKLAIVFLRGVLDGKPLAKLHNISPSVHFSRSGTVGVRTEITGEYSSIQTALQKCKNSRIALRNKSITPAASKMFMFSVNCYDDIDLTQPVIVNGMDLRNLAHVSGLRVDVTGGLVSYVDISIGGIAAPTSASGGTN